jgi:hypothetical protein
LLLSTMSSVPAYSAKTMLAKLGFDVGSDAITRSKSRLSTAFGWSCCRAS